MLAILGYAHAFPCTLSSAAVACDHTAHAVMLTVSGAALVVTILCVAACADSAAICSRAGGEYANGACTLSGPSQLAVRHWCETHGGVHLAGPNICGYGSGGP
jgi:hypothetical protein